MMETAKIKKGTNYSFSAEYSRVNPEKTSVIPETQIPHILGADFKISRGFLFGKSSGYGIELGMDLGLLYSPSVLGEIEFNNDSQEYEAFYYPYKLNYNYIVKIFSKFGILQNRSFSLAGRVEIAGTDLASLGIIGTKELQNKKQLYSGVKLFNRFVKTPEKKLFSDGYGEYLFFGIKSPIKEKSFIDIISYNYVLFEFGIVNNLWYNSKPTICLSIGITHK
jgi:hypothetical protein